MRAVPDAGFLTFLPEDARFRVSRFEVTLARGKRPVQQTQVINGPQGRYQLDGQRSSCR
ncbi:MAG: GldM family protein [Hymenobacter sp.]